MNISIFGTGYVGLVTGICLSNLGNTITCVDINQEKITRLNSGIIPIYEPGLSEILEENKARISFTTNAKSAIEKAEIIYIAVGTPQSANGSCDLTYIKQVTKTIAKYMQNGVLIVTKSTVPVGTNDWIEAEIKKQFKGNFIVISNPEFLREGNAVYDFFHPDRIIIGVNNRDDAKIIEELYLPLQSELVITDRRSAELIKYASNAFLATKISFINSLSHLAEKVSADIESVSKGMGLDSRIGNKFLQAGIGYGGSCFPKDVSALIYMSKKNKTKLPLLEAAQTINKKQKVHLVKKLEEKTHISNKKIAVLGLAFKPDTDDIREAPSLEIIDQLLKHNAQVWAWDPLAEDIVKSIFSTVHYCPSPYEALDQADAGLIVTEWGELKELDLKKVKKIMKTPLLLDGRNIINKVEAENLGIDYFAIGRSS